MLRRAGVFATPREPASLNPKEDDSGDLLNTKWKQWVKRESFKRSVSLDVRSKFKLMRIDLQFVLSSTQFRRPFRTIRAH